MGFCHAWRLGSVVWEVQECVFSLNSLFHSLDVEQAGDSRIGNLVSFSFLKVAFFA